MAHVELVEQTFRAGQQSLWGMRLRGGMVEAVADDLDQAGFRAVEVTGSSLMECSVRYSQEDPWESLDLWRRWMPNSELRAPVTKRRRTENPEPSVATVKTVASAALPVVSVTPYKRPSLPCTKVTGFTASGAVKCFSTTNPLPSGAKRNSVPPLNEPPVGFVP